MWLSIFFKSKIYSSVSEHDKRKKLNWKKTKIYSCIQYTRIQKKKKNPINKC